MAPQSPPHPALEGLGIGLRNEFSTLESPLMHSTISTATISPTEIHALNLAEALAEEPNYKSPLNTGDMAFMMFCVTMVALMTPGIGLFQAGVIRRKNALSIILQVFSGWSIGSMLFFVCGFSLCYGPSYGADGAGSFLSGVIGNPFTYFMWNNVSQDWPLYFPKFGEDLDGWRPYSGVEFGGSYKEVGGN